MKWPDRSERLSRNKRLRETCHSGVSVKSHRQVKAVEVDVGEVAEGAVGTVVAAVAEVGVEAAGNTGTWGLIFAIFDYSCTPDKGSLLMRILRPIFPDSQ